MSSISGILSQSDIDEICLQRADEGLDYLAHPNDCSSYIICDNPASLGSCEEFYFNEEAQTCDYKENVQCDNVEPEPQPEPEPETEPPTEAQTTIITTTTETTTTSTTAELVPQTTLPTTKEVEIETTLSSASTTSPLESVLCPEVSHEIVFKADPDSCLNYYLCFNGVAMPMKCADNLHFNSEKQKCDFKENVRCRLGIPTCEIYMNEFFPHESSCNLFYYCRYGHLSLQQCPYFYYWNEEKHECQMNYRLRC